MDDLLDAGRILDECIEVKLPSIDVGKLIHVSNKVFLIFHPIDLRFYTRVGMILKQLFKKAESRPKPIIWPRIVFQFEYF